MKLDDYMKGMKVDVANCKVRGICPLGKFCGTKVNDGGPVLTPSVLEINKNDILWTDLHFDPRVLIVRKGVFSCMVHADRDKEEVPLSLYGAGIAVGMGELYAPAAVPSRASGGQEVVPMSSTYYLRAIFNGEICSLPAGVVRQLLESLPPRAVNQILSCVLTNSFCSATTMMKVVSHQSLQDRLIALLLFFKEMANRSGNEVDTFHVTHEELSHLVASDRVSTTRALHRIRDLGLIEIGYKAIKLLPAIMERTDLVNDAATEFYIPDVI